MKLTTAQRDVLTVMASTPATRPWPLYRFRSGPRLMRPDFTWLSVPQRQVDRLVEAGLLAPVQADGLPSRVAYWMVTDAGRAAVAQVEEVAVEPSPEPRPAMSRRRRSERRA